VRLPSLIIDAANEGRKLSAEIYGFFEGEPVTQVVKDRAQDRERLLRIGKIAVFAQLLKPFLRLLNSPGNRRGECHGGSLWFK
jgi:hypothetical protein